MAQNKPYNIDSEEVKKIIDNLIKSGIKPDEIDYDEIVFQANLQIAKSFYND